MTENAQTAFESFLVEDVILTLGNLRGSLGWLGDRPEQSRAGLDRLDRQLGLLEDRARAVCRDLHSARPNARAEGEPDNLFAADPATAGLPRATAHPETDDISIETAILDAIGDGEGYDESPVFRSRRG